MPPAIIAGAIAGVATIGGAVLTSKSNKKAVTQATEAQKESAADQIAFQREAYAQNTANLSPWMNRGNQAGDTIMAALGLGGTQGTVAAAPQPQQGALTQFYGDGQQFLGSPYQGQADYWASGGYGSPNYVADAGAPRALPEMWLSPQAGAALNYGQQQQQPQPQAQPGQTPQQAATDAYEIFKQSTGYQSRLQEGQRSQGAMYSALGTYQSGARDKALARFNQDYASREFGNWMGALGNQQGLGFAGASALAGVSQGNADRMGDISQNSANFATQAAIARAQNQGALWTGIAGAAGQFAGGLSSYRR